MTSEASAPIATSSREWTAERIGELDQAEVRQLLANARRLGAESTATLCEQALARCATASRHACTDGNPRMAKNRNLVSLRKALELRGVYAENSHLSWGGVRKSDGRVVFMLWADSVLSGRLELSYLLWASNKDNARPWSDEPGGRERLKHCGLALLQQKAEGLLVYGVALEGEMPEKRRITLYGADPQKVLELTVEHRGDEYWAAWGRARAAVPVFGLSR